MAQKGNRLWNLLFGDGKRKPGRFYYRMIWMGCISACIPIVMASILYYHSSLSNLTRQVESESGFSLEIIEGRVERALQGIERDSLQLFDEPIVKDTFYMSDFSERRLYHYQLLEYLSRQKISRDNIESIYYYNFQANVLLTTELGFVRPQEFGRQADLKALADKSQMSRWEYLPESGAKGLVSYIRPLPAWPNTPVKGVLVFQVRLDSIQDDLTEYLSLFANRLLFVMAPDGSMLFHNTDRSSADDKRRLVGDIVSLGQSGGVLADAGGERFLYSYIKSEMGRSYVSLIPEKALASQIWWVRWVSIVAVLFFVGFGLLLSMIISRMAYNPLQNLLQYGSSIRQGEEGAFRKDRNEFVFLMECFTYLRKQTQSLSSLVKKLEPTLKESFYQKLIHREYINKKTLLEDCAKYNIAAQGYYAVLVLDSEHDFGKTRFIPEDRPVISFAIANIMEEVLAAYPGLHGFTVNDYQGRKVVIVQYDGMDSEERVRDHMLAYCREALQSIRQYLSLQAAIGIGRMYNHIVDVSISYKEALVELQYRMFQESDTILHIDSLETETTGAKFVYPVDIEAAVLQALNESDPGLAETQLAQFALKIKSFHSYHLTFQAYYILLSSILHALEVQGEGALDMFEENPFDQLREYRTTEEINDWFAKSCFPLYIQIAHQLRMSAGKSFIEQICRFVENNVYSDISLTICAEQVNMNPSYISRVFRKEKGVSFVEYVMEAKMNEAKLLLLGTDKSVGEIAALLGYTERGLNRLFQKFLSIPPGQYRQQHR